MPRLWPSCPYPLSSSTLSFGLISFSSSLAMETAANNNTVVAQKEKQPETEMAKKKNQEKEMEKKIEEKIGQPPEKPLPGDCCGSGCQTCVWDIYNDDLELYSNKRDAFLKYLSQPHSAKP